MFKKIVISFGISFFFAALATAILFDLGIKFALGSDIRRFGYLFLGIAIFSGGMLNLNFYLESKNRWFNLMMVITNFFAGGLIIVLWVLEFVGLFK